MGILSSTNIRCKKSHVRDPNLAIINNRVQTVQLERIHSHWRWWFQPHTWMAALQRLICQIERVNEAASRLWRKPHVFVSYQPALDIEFIPHQIAIPSCHALWTSCGIDAGSRVRGSLGLGLSEIWRACQSHWIVVINFSKPRPRLVMGWEDL